MSNPDKQAFLDFVEDMTLGIEGSEYERAAKADQVMALRLAQFDPHLASLIAKTSETRLEVRRYLQERSERTR